MLKLILVDFDVNNANFTLYLSDYLKLFVLLDYIYMRLFIAIYVFYTQFFAEMCMQFSLFIVVFNSCVCLAKRHMQ